MELCPCTKSPVSLVVTPWVMYVLGHRPRLVSYTDKVTLQTSQLPENDRTSITYKEYLAGIDVSMGGRVAEELSEL